MRYKLFTIGGVPCYVHIGTFFFALYMLLIGRLALFAISGVSILLHEGAHMAASLCVGHRPRRIELTPLGAMVNLEDDEMLSPAKRLTVLLSGPLASLLLCLVAVWLLGRGVLPRQTGYQLFCSNFLILSLNLLPVLPLDGGRMAALLLSMILPQERIRFMMRLAGSIVGGLMIVFNIVLCLTLGGWNFSLGMTGCFLLYSAALGTTSQTLTDLRMLMDRKIHLEQGKCMPCRTLAVMETTPLQQVINELKPNRYTRVLVLQTGTMSELYAAGESTLMAAYLNRPWDLCSSLVKIQ